MEELYARPLPELRKQAKELGIKQHYIMTKATLAMILSNPTHIEWYQIQKKTIRQLRDEAKARGVPHVYKYPRNELFAMLYPTYVGGRPPQQDKNDDRTEKHDHPKDRQSK
jgi:hypothetical protein